MGPPEDAVASEHSTGFWEVRTVGGVDIADPDAIGPAVLDVWTRFPGAPADPALNQALLAFATDGFLIGTAMRPHPGVGQSLAHRTISTSVITHTLTFHAPVDAGAWMLLSHESPTAGQGRSYGRAHVYTESRGTGGVLRAGEHDPGVRRGPGAGPRGPRRPTDECTSGPHPAQMYIPPLTPMIWPVM